MNRIKNVISKKSGYHKSFDFFNWLVVFFTVITNYVDKIDALAYDHSTFLIETTNPIAHFNTTDSENYHELESKNPSTVQQAVYSDVYSISSTEPVPASYDDALIALPESTSNSLSFLSSPSRTLPDVSSASAMTVVDIKKLSDAQPSTEHVYIGSIVPNKRESDAILKALDWLTKKRSTNYGWNNDTHMVILAKELSEKHDFSDATDAHLQIIHDLEDLLSIKQMTIEILSLLEHHHHTVTPKVVDVKNLARFILAMGSLCKDPKHFMNQHDLLAMIQHHESSDDYSFALSTLAVCSLGEHVHRRQIRKLINIALDPTEQSIETTAMVILALRCVMTDRHHRHLEHFVYRPALRLALLQSSQGNIGSLRSTALAMQALQDFSSIPSTSWNREAASTWILDRQRDDGGWTEEPLTDGQDASIETGLTADIVLALGQKGLRAVRMLQCNHAHETSADRYESTQQKLASPVALTTAVPREQVNNIETVSYTYTIWFSIKSQDDDLISLAMTSPRNITFYQAMVQAADIDPRFSFEAHDWPNGHYIHTLGGRIEEPIKFNYWLLYQLPKMPDPKNIPGNEFITSHGVDEIIVKDNQHYLYWFKKL